MAISAYLQQCYMGAAERFGAARAAVLPYFGGTQTEILGPNSGEFFHPAESQYMFSHTSAAAAKLMASVGSFAARALTYVAPFAAIPLTAAGVELAYPAEFSYDNLTPIFGLQAAFSVLLMGAPLKASAQWAIGIAGAATLLALAAE